MTVQGSDREVLKTAADWCDQGHRVGLVTVARTWGAAPRQAGSLMAMREDGHYAGSVSGGCVEADLVGRWRDGEIGEPFPGRIDYGVDREQASRMGLPCGGRLELVVEHIDSAAPVRALLERLDRGELVTRRLCLSTGEASVHPAAPTDAFEYGEADLRKVYGPAWHMLLVGAGELARYVAQIARMLDYRVTVCDPRDDYALDWEAEGVERTALMPDDAVRELADHPRSVILTLAHDPRLDDMALMEALDSKAFYVGALGSKRTSAKRLERLAGLGLSTEAVARLHAPVGLRIGSHTPAEIAVAITAEVTAERNRER